MVEIITIPDGDTNWGASMRTNLTELSTAIDALNGAYKKPVTGIPEIDLDAGVRTKLNSSSAPTNPGMIYNVVDYGAVSDGATNSVVAIQAAIDATPVGGTLLVPGNYAVGSTLVINKAMTFKGNGSIKATTDAACISVEASNVTIAGISLRGRQRATWVSGARGIQSVGTLAAPYNNLSIIDVSLTSFGGSGIYLQFVNDILVSNLNLTACTYYGVAFICCNRALVDASSIVDINTGGLPNSYGVTASRLNGDLAVYPRSTDITVQDSLITDVVDWVAFDTHGGVRIKAIRNVVLRCKRGIDFVASVGPSGSNEFAPLDCLIMNNSVDGTGIASSHGIGFSGATGTPGSPTELATGTIIGNQVIRCGDPTNNQLGGIWLRGTEGVRITSNQVIEPGSHGLIFVSDNKSFMVTDLTVTDPWSDTHAIPSVVATRSTYNTGVISSFYGRRGTKTATTVLAYGFYQSDPATTSTIQMGTGCAVESGALIAESSAGLRTFLSMNASQITVGRGNGRLGFYGLSTPIAKPTISGSRSDGTALASTITVLTALGLANNTTTT